VDKLGKELDAGQNMFGSKVSVAALGESNVGNPAKYLNAHPNPNPNPNPTLTLP